jgi:hypothetical protein
MAMNAREQLALVDRHIAETMRHIALQKETITQPDRDDHATDLAETMLDALEQSLRAVERHRALILERLKGAERQ